MDIPQHILNKFIVRSDYLDWIRNETFIFAYLDLTNMFHWQDALGWRFRIEDIVEQLFTFPNIKEVKVYYGSNERDEKNSEAFHTRIKKTGAVLRTKPMKFITKDMNGGVFFQRRTMTLLDESVKTKIKEVIKEVQRSGIVIEEPKCNFDIDFGKFYTGKKTYIESENPAFGGTA